METDEMYRTGLKCKNCGYEIAIMRGSKEMGLFHTGMEEGYAPNYYCFMVRKEDISIPCVGMVGQKHAELTGEDRKELLELLLNGDSKTSSGGKDGN